MADETEHDRIRTLENWRQFFVEPRITNIELDIKTADAEIKRAHTRIDSHDRWRSWVFGFSTLATAIAGFLGGIATTVFKGGGYH